VIVIDEGKLRIVFDPPAWTAVKWDDHPLYTHGIGKLNGELTDAKAQKTRPEGTKAVDIVACDASALYLIELKDFRGFSAENAFRQEQELPLEVGLKVRDTMAGLSGGRATGLHAASLEPFYAALTQRLPVKVIAWIVEDAPASATRRRKRSAVDSTRSTQLVRRLQWLTRQVWVDDPLAPSIELQGVRIHQRP